MRTPTRPDEAFAPTLTHRDVLEFATIEGARACALEDKVGSLDAGKQADIVLLNVNAINTMPMVDPIGTIVVFSDTSNVDSVFVAGQRGEAQRQLVDADLERDLPGARRVEEPHPRGRRLAARLGGRGVRDGLGRDRSVRPAVSTGRTRALGAKGEGMGTVVIVGGTQGLGRELAQSYARRRPRRGRDGTGPVPRG